MRIAIISDIHGNLVALEAALADIRTRSPDLIVNLGDCATGPAWPRETVELLGSLELPTVRGNHDRWLGSAEQRAAKPMIEFTASALSDAQRDALVALPPRLELDGVLAVHGTPDRDTEYLLEEKRDGRLARLPTSVVAARLGNESASLVLCGHSHTQHSVQVGPECLVVNPGSVGFPRYAGDDDIANCEAGSPHARYAVATRRGARWSVDLVVLDYDWSAVVARAKANGFPGWEAGFTR
jgi:putative phosphoesterase